MPASKDRSVRLRARPGLRFTTSLWFYAVSLSAASTALFGIYGLPVAAFILLVWWQLLCGAHREAVALDRRHAQRLGRVVTGESLVGVPGRRGDGRMELIVVVLIAALCLGLLMPARSDKDPMQHAAVSMRAVAKAVEAYHQQHGALPPVQLFDAGGRSRHSWRALILPYLGEDKLAAAYDIEESWDGPNNALLHQYRPWHFQLYYPQHAGSREDSSLHLITTDDQRFWIVEQEGEIQHWLDPAAPAQEDWLAGLSQVPSLEEGFWDHGFFRSVHRGRLVANPEATWAVHATGASLAFEETGGEQRGGVGRPVVRWHVGSAVRLLVFLAIALYPLRWLHRL